MVWIDILMAIAMSYALLSLAANIVMIADIGIYGFKYLDKFLNPITIYKTNNVNKFGCILLCLFFNIFFIIVAVLFWLYVLCTFGRDVNHNE